MGRIKSLVIMHRDVNPKDDTPHLRDLILDYWHTSGDRAGLTDEQMLEVRDDQGD
jgi:hypothetical protein